MGTGRPRAKGAEINKPKYSGDSGAAEVGGKGRAATRIVSSRRRPGPITTQSSLAKTGSWYVRRYRYRVLSLDHAVWVLAFARTTIERQVRPACAATLGLTPARAASPPPSARNSSAHRRRRRA